MNNLIKNVLIASLLSTLLITGCVDKPQVEKLKVGDCFTEDTAVLKLLKVIEVGQYSYLVKDINNNIYSLPFETTIIRRDCFDWFDKAKK